MNSLYVLRGLLLAALGCTAYVLQPFSLSPPVAAGFAVLLAGVCLVLEKHLRQTNLKHLLGAAVGCFAGLVIASLLLLSFRLVLPTPFPAYGSSWIFLQLAGVLVLAYVGLSAGAAKGDMLNLSALGGVFGAEQSGSGVMKLLDTSVIIDGRIADIAETGFLEGTWGLPQFVLRELQLVADSSDSAKRNRGRRGLDILQRLQKMQRLELRILEEDFPQVRDVDLKLIELAKLYSCKIVTNDFNLNKVAQVRGVEVLNINELANTLKPIVLPGETMRVFILKEGKEYNQGVAYLDDGTMVVVDHARRMIGKNVDVIVTSVLQTTAGKMIFGKIEERQNGTGRSLSEVPERPLQQPQPSTAGGPALP